MPDTITRADRAAHLKIIATALVAVAAFVAITLNVRLGGAGTGEKVVVKAGHASAYANKPNSAIR
jgi:hypothetical protein